MGSAGSGKRAAWEGATLEHQLAGDAIFGRRRAKATPANIKKNQENTPSWMSLKGMRENYNWKT